MHFDPPLEQATLEKRYKRFLADITLPNGETRTIHCANTGAMTGCAEPGNLVWYSRPTIRKENIQTVGSSPRHKLATESA